jgi:hypothetical protein
MTAAASINNAPKKILQKQTQQNDCQNQSQGTGAASGQSH